MKMTILKSPHWRVLLAALSSALTWFAWACWANWGEGYQTLVSGLSQGGVSFTTTFIGSFLLETGFARLGSSLPAMAATVAGVSGLSLACMLTVHRLAGTPNMLLTILPVFSVVLIYCTSYLIGLKKFKHKNESNAVEVACR